MNGWMDGWKYGGPGKEGMSFIVIALLLRESSKIF